MSKWIEIKKGCRMPRGKGECLVIHELRNRAEMVEFGKFYDDKGKLRQSFYTDGDIWGRVTHWMPLPEPPKDAR